MRLLHTKSLQLHNFDYEKPPGYWILSHQWKGREVSLQDFERERHLPPAQCSRGTIKIREFCELLVENKVEWCWVDTCCIDKTSSAELGEAINSMCKWYSGAKRCIVYMRDVTASEDEALLERSFRESGWFTRGWTLQELLAPRLLDFYDRKWTLIGNRRYWANVIEDVTGIPQDVYGNMWKVGQTCIAHRMSWLSSRKTTRTEDLAYCMFGIFDVNLPLIYGEGMKAFLRLQLEIIKQSADESIFAWTSHEARSGLLARHPRAFAEAANTLLYSNRSLPRRVPYYLTNQGIALHVPNGEIGPQNKSMHCEITLNCVNNDHKFLTICIEKADDVFTRVHCERLGIARARIASQPWSSKTKLLYVEQYNIRQSISLNEAMALLGRCTVGKEIMQHHKFRPASDITASQWWLRAVRPEGMPHDLLEKSRQEIKDVHGDRGPHRDIKSQKKFKLYSEDSDPALFLEASQTTLGSGSSDLAADKPFEKVKAVAVALQLDPAAKAPTLVVDLLADQQTPIASNTGDAGLFARIHLEGDNLSSVQPGGVVLVKQIIIKSGPPKSSVQLREADQDPSKQFFSRIRRQAGLMPGENTVETGSWRGISQVESDTEDAMVGRGAVVAVDQNATNLGVATGPRGISGRARIERVDVVRPLQPHLDSTVIGAKGTDSVDYSHGGQILYEDDGSTSLEGDFVSYYGAEHEGTSGGDPNVGAATTSGHLDACRESKTMGQATQNLRVLLKNRVG